MSGDDSSSETNGIELSRRTFTKAAGAAAGAGLLGASAGTAGADHGSIDRAHFANPRVQELAKVWQKGYRGRADRTIGLTDSGLDARHPDLGPWNGMKIVDDGGALKVVDPEKQPTFEKASSETFESDTVQAGPGTFVTSEEGDGIIVYEFSTDTKYTHVDATLTWSPSQENANDLEFRLDKLDNGTWKEVERTATASVPETMEGVELENNTDYRFVAERYVNTVSEVQVSGELYELGTKGASMGDGDVTGKDPFSYGYDPSDGDIRPKCVGWADPGSRYGNYDKPRDPDGHGSHCASIMGGSGRASAFAKYETDENSRTLRTADSETYYVDAKRGQGVFASAYGENIEIEISRPFQGVIASSSIGSDTSTLDNNVVSVPADEHLPEGESSGTFQIDIRAGQPGERAGNSNVGVGRLEEAAYGTLKDPTADVSDRSDADGEVSLHSGVAPNSSLIGLQGFGDPTAMLAKHASEFTEDFKLRSVNMSWGYVGGAPLGAFGGELAGDVVEDIKEMATGGILTVAAAGNSATPANGNGAPAVADEAISVVATDARDGITSYSSGGVGAQDEDDQGTYQKPDVTAPGGSVPDLIQAAEAGDADTDETDQPPIRDYTGIAGTSMASPYTNGVAALVAEAMEFAADGTPRREGHPDLGDDEEPAGGPDGVTLPAPANTSGGDVQRLKQVLLATASETALTAAPYHEGKAPTYSFGERDPYEGYGRVNPDAAVDAVSNDLFDGDLDDASLGDGTVDFSDKSIGTVGLDVPNDSRAVAGYVNTVEGDLTITLDVPTDTDIGGDDASMAQAPPHIDLLVYDAKNPSTRGEPNVVAKDSTRDGQAAEVRIKTDGTGFDPFGNPESQVSSRFGVVDDQPLIVVAKLVNVPGLVNGFDYRANLTLDATLDINDLPNLPASGERRTDATQFIAGEQKEVQLTVSDVPALEGTDVTATVWDRVPDGWTVPEFFDYEGEFREPQGPNGPQYIKLGTVEAADFSNSGSEQFTYVAESPNENGEYQFGPAYVEVEDQGSFDDEKVEVGGDDYNVARTKDTDDDGKGDVEIAKGNFTGSTDNIVVGGTNMQSSSDTSTTDTDSTTDTVDDTTDTVDDTTDSTTSDGGSSGGSDDDSTTDTVTDTVDDTTDDTL